MRKILLGAICGLSVFLSGNTGCGEDLAEDLKDDIENQVKESGTACASLGAAINSLKLKAAACYTAEELEGFEVTDEDIAQCTQDYSECSAAEKAAMAEATNCLKDVDSCTEGGQSEFELALDDCMAPLESVACMSDSSEQHEEPVPSDDAP